MKRNLNILWGLLLIGGGLLFLAQNFGYLDNVSGYLWALVFGVIGGSFIYLFTVDRTRWWALIPGVVLLTLAVMFALNTWNVELFDPWSGTIVLGGVALSFALVYIVRRDLWWALIPAGVLTTLAVVARLDNVSGLSTAAILFFGMAATFLLVLIVTRMRWALFPVIGLAFIGFVIIFGQSRIINLVWPLGLIVAGLFLLFRVWRPANR
jgi:hypothetical protein